MVKVVLTANLQKYYPEREFKLKATSIAEILRLMDEKRPQFSSYILEDDRSVRKHVNIFLNGALIPKTAVSQSINDGDTVHIMQSLSGG